MLCPYPYESYFKHCHHVAEYFVIPSQHRQSKEKILTKTMRIQVVELLKRTSVFLFFFLVGRKGTRRLSSSMSDMVLSAVRSFDRWQQQRRRRRRHGYSGRTRTTSMQPGESITEVDLTATADMLSSIKITFKFSLQHLRRKKTETFES